MFVRKITFKEDCMFERVIKSLDSIKYKRQYEMQYDIYPSDLTLVKK